MPTFKRALVLTLGLTSLGCNMPNPVIQAHTAQALMAKPGTSAFKAEGDSVKNQEESHKSEDGSQDNHYQDQERRPSSEPICVLATPRIVYVTVGPAENNPAKAASVTVETPVPPAATPTTLATPTPAPEPSSGPTATIFVHQFVGTGPDSDKYLLSSVNVKQYAENWGRPGDPVVYFGPDAPNQPATRTYHYTFSRPIATLSLQAATIVWNWNSASAYGSEKVEISSDNANWTVLSDNRLAPLGSSINTDLPFAVPIKILGQKEIYVRIGLTSTYASNNSPAQFARAMQGATGSSYSFKATY